MSTIQPTRQRNTPKFTSNYPKFPNNQPNITNSNYIPKTPQKYQRKRYTYTPSTILQTQRKIDYTNQYNTFNQQKNKQKYMKQQPIGYQYNNVSYRECMYFGKLLHTQLIPSTTPPTSLQQSNINTKSLRNIIYHNNYHNNSYKIYKHGPGILVLDSGIWLIGKWQYDNLIGQRVYCIGADFGIAQIQLSNRNKISQQQKQKQKYLNVQNINFLGYNSKNQKTNSRYTMIGRKNYTFQKPSYTNRQNDQSQNNWIWYIKPTNNKSQQIYHQIHTSLQNKNNPNQQPNNTNIYQNKLNSTTKNTSQKKNVNQTQTNMTKHNKLLTNLTKYKTYTSQNNSIPTISISQTNNYQTLIKNIKQILCQSTSSQKYNTNKNKDTDNIAQYFKIQQITDLKTKIITIPNQTNMNKQQQINRQKIVLISSKFNIAQNIYIKIKITPISNNNNNNNNNYRLQYQYHIQQLGIYVKDIKHNININKSKDINISKQPNIWPKYLYKVSQIQQKKYQFNNTQITLPNFIIKQQLSNIPNTNYTYTCTYNILPQQYPSNIKSSTTSTSPYISTQYSSKQYNKCIQQKSSQHIRSINFTNTYHTKLIQQIHQIMLNIYTVYMYSKIVEQYYKQQVKLNNRNNNSRNISIKEQKRIILQKQKQYYNRQYMNISRLQQMNIIYDINKIKTQQATIDDIKKQLSAIKTNHKFPTKNTKSKPFTPKPKYQTKPTNSSHRINSKQPHQLFTTINNQTNINNINPHKYKQLNYTHINYSRNQSLEWSPPFRQNKSPSFVRDKNNGYMDKLMQEYNTLNRQLVKQAKHYKISSSIPYTMLLQDKKQQINRSQQNTWKNQSNLSNSKEKTNISRIKQLKNKIITKDNLQYRN